MEKRDNGQLLIDGTAYTTRVSDRFTSRKAWSPPAAGRIVSFIPGTVVELFVAPGVTISEGDDILVLEAMKMKNRLKSHVSGQVVAVHVSPGDKVPKGCLLVEIA